MTMADVYNDIVQEDTLLEEWDNSEAKDFLEQLVGSGEDKEGGKKIRANIIYKHHHDRLKDFPQKFVTKRLQEIRKGTEKSDPEDSRLLAAWEESRAKVVLSRVVEHGFDCDEKGNHLSATQVYNLREEFKAFPQTFITKQLKLARKGKPKPPRWGKSKARDTLTALIAVGMDRDNNGKPLDVLEVYEMDPSFAVYPIKQFSGYLEELQESIHELQDRSLRDGLAVHNFYKNNKRTLLDAPRFNYKAYPKWQGSNAQTLLRKDLIFMVENNFHLKPIDLHACRPEYREFPLSVFRNHIYKEVIHDKQVRWNKHKKKKEVDELK